MKNRTSQESAKAVAKAVDKINSVLDAIMFIKTYSWLDYKKFKAVGYGKVISDICKKYNVNEKHIRTVGDFSRNIVILESKIDKE